MELRVSCHFWCLGRPLMIETHPVQASLIFTTVTVSCLCVASVCEHGCRGKGQWEACNGSFCEVQMSSVIRSNYVFIIFLSAFECVRVSPHLMSQQSDQRRTSLLPLNSKNLLAQQEKGGHRNRRHAITRGSGITISS